MVQLRPHSISTFGIGKAGVADLAGLVLRAVSEADGELESRNCPAGPVHWFGARVNFCGTGPRDDDSAWNRQFKHAGDSRRPLAVYRASIRRRDLRFGYFHLARSNEDQANFWMALSGGEQIGGRLPGVSSDAG